MKEIARAYEGLPVLERPRSWAAVLPKALCANYRALCGLLQPGTAPIAVVKADAYGHGMAVCAGALMDEGCRRFAVSCLEEGIALRQICARRRAAADILILGYTDPAFAATLAGEDLIQTLLSPAYAGALSLAAGRAGVRVRAHCALDTGMNRLGFAAKRPEEAMQTAKEILRLCNDPFLRVEGLFTHFAGADEAACNAVTAAQTDCFRSVRARILAERPLFCHICNSAGMLTRPEDHWDGVRLGIALWGVPPVANCRVTLAPVMRLQTRIVHLHRVLPGERVGYGGDFCAARECVIATLPIGYADGWLRAYSGAGVTIENETGCFCAPIVGRVCMDQCMADVTGMPVRVGDLVTLFGREPRDLCRLAAFAGTIPYEALCLISSRIPRVYLEQETGEKT